MGLITEEVEVSISNNYRYYEELGYVIPKYIDDHSRLSIERGTTIKVSINDLFVGSKIKVECICDNLGETFYISYYRYLEKVKNDGKVYCHKCSMKLFGNELGRINRLNNGISFYQWCIDNNRQDILNRWDYQLTGFGPEDIGYGANKIIYLFCQNGIHESISIKANHLTNGIHPHMGECSNCSTIEHMYSEYMFLWSDKNDNLPNKYSYGDSTKVYWKCENNKHDDYTRRVSLSCLLSFRCPKCVQERDESFLQEKVRLYLEELSDKFDWILNHEYDCNLKCLNPKTNYPLRYDNEIISNGFKLIVESHGQQHYESCKFHYKQAKKKGTSLQQEFEYQCWKDEYKKQYALNNGYYYLAIPYWADDENETYKIMIDDTLNYIHENI